MDADEKEEPKEPVMKKMRRKYEEHEGPTRRGDQVDGATGANPDPGSSRVGAQGNMPDRIGEESDEEPEEARAAGPIISPCEPTSADVTLHRLNHH